MPWKIKKVIFGTNFVFDIDPRLPIQGIYNFRLRRKWADREYLDREESRSFIEYSLRYLPNGSFIVFHFGSSEDYWMQFCKLNGNIILDIPLWLGNIFYGRDEEILGLVKSLRFKRKYSKRKSFALARNRYDIIRTRDDNKQIRINIDGLYRKASKLTLSLLERVFQLHNPNIYRYESGRLMTK